MNYAFVKAIHAGGVPVDLLDRLRRTAVRGSHTDMILREALLDRPYATAELSRVVARVAGSGDFILNSFPSPRFAGARLLLRSEFLLLRELGAGRLNGGARGVYVENTFRRIMVCRPSAVIYRCLDYNPVEVAFLEPDEETESARPRSRGAQRLIDDEELVEMDCRVMNRFASVGIPVDVLLPFVQFPDQVDVLRERIWRCLSPQARRRAKLGIMLEVPINLYQVASFTRVDFFVLGPGDLLRYFYGDVGRDDPGFEKAAISALREPLRHALSVIDALGGRQVFYAKQLVDTMMASDAATYRRTLCRPLYMPDQLAAWQTVG